MIRIPKTAIGSWVNQNGVYGPAAVSSICPKCNEKVLFSLGHHSHDNRRNLFMSTATCPGCKQTVHFITLNPQNSQSQNNTAHGVVYSYPAPEKYHEIQNLEDDVPEPLQRSYHSTVDAYNSGNYTATAVCCRRTLEGLFQYLLPSNTKHQPLIKAIKEVESTVDLAKPLNELSHLIRHGGNLGAHFDMEKEPDQEMARSMVELLEYLLSYLYVLPTEIGKLNKVLGKDA